MASHLSIHDVTPAEEGADYGSIGSTGFGYKRLLESSSESDEYDSLDPNSNNTTTAHCGSIGSTRFGYKRLLESSSESDEYDSLDPSADDTTTAQEGADLGADCGSAGNIRFVQGFVYKVDEDGSGLRSGYNDQQGGDEGVQGGQKAGLNDVGLGACKNNEQGGGRDDGGQRLRGDQVSQHGSGQNDDVEQVFQTFMQLGLNRGAGHGKILNIRD